MGELLRKEDESGDGEALANTQRGLFIEAHISDLYEKCRAWDAKWRSVMMKNR